MKTKKRPTKSKHGTIAGAEVIVSVLPESIRSELPGQSSVDLFGVFIDGQVLRTPSGSPIHHSDVRSMRELAAELDFSDRLDVTSISLYSLACTQIDFMEKGGIQWTEAEFCHLLLNDPILRTCAGPEVVDQMKYLHTVVTYLEKHGIDYPHLPQMPLEDMSWFGNESRENFEALVKYVNSSADSLDPAAKAVFVTTAKAYGSAVLGLMVATQEITPQEMGVVLLTAHCVYSKVWGDIDRAKEKKLLGDIIKNGECLIRYLQLFQPKLSEIERLIQSGESVRLEFKSTLRWNLQTNRADPAIERSVLKSITGFLNTDGGTLLIGIKDDGTVLGIEADQFPNEDKYLLHFTHLLNDKIGKQYCDFVRWGLKTINERKILRVDCLKSPSPVFLKTNGQEEFFIRTGPSTVQLSGSELLDYSRSHFYQ